MQKSFYNNISYNISRIQDNYSLCKKNECDMKNLKIILASIMCFILPGCTSNSIDFYKDKKQKIDMREFFNGEVEGWGALFDIGGKQTRSFYVLIKGSWKGNDGILDEVFDFDDGEHTKRKWEVYFENDQIFKGRAHDVIGYAKGHQLGSAINLNYVLEVPYNNSTIKLSMDDWMYKLYQNNILNKTSLKKFVFKFRC